MSKIYIDRHHKKKLINNVNQILRGHEIEQTITFVKKYNDIYNEVTNILLLPIDLLNIIFNYVNEYYTLSYVIEYDCNLNPEFCDMFIICNNVKYWFEMHLFNFTKKVQCILTIYCCDQLYNFDGDFVNFNGGLLFNHFMKKYYGKYNYLNTSDVFDEYKDSQYKTRQELLNDYKIIKRPRILKHLIIILKIFIDIIMKTVNKSNTVL